MICIQFCGRVSVLVEGEVGQNTFNGKAVGDMDSCFNSHSGNSLFGRVASHIHPRILLFFYPTIDSN